jgi:hypothetical protein
MEGSGEGRTTNWRIQELLPRMLGEMSAQQKERPDLILAAWPQVVGERLAPLTQAVQFKEGILLVKVRSSTLYSVLTQQEKGRLVTALRAAFPRVEIKTIQFRMG